MYRVWLELITTYATLTIDICANLYLMIIYKILIIISELIFNHI